MDYSSYNNYILNYLDNDKTKNAIMLSAPWGAGKSYYIENFLKPFINEKKEKRACIIISLYGLKSTKEISKAIYLDIRCLSLENTEKEKKGEMATKIDVYGKAVAKKFGQALIKRLVGDIDLSLNISDKDLQRIYESVDLSDRLIVFEDLERSEIDILTLLGFVNDLVEHDGAKVLLVANESELYKMEPNEEENEAKPSSTAYKTIKEKTVGDTIHFMPDLVSSIKDILAKFEASSPFIAKLAKDEGFIYEVAETMEYRQESNFRTLEFTIQKISDIFDGCENLDPAFLRACFLGCLIYSFSYRKGNTGVWKGGSSAQELGSGEYPLYQFIFNYLNNQDKPSPEEVKQHEKSFFDAKIKIENNAALETLSDFYCRSEKEVIDAVSKVKRALDSMPKTNYGTLANYLACISDILNNERVIKECEERMIERLRSDDDYNKNIVLETLQFHSGYTLESEESKKHYNNLIEAMKEAMNSKEHLSLLEKGQIKTLLKMYRDDKESPIQRAKFFADFDPMKFEEELLKCSPGQIDEIRRIFLRTYEPVNISEILSVDLPNIKELRRLLGKDLKERTFADRIQKNQIKMLYDNLGMFIINLGGEVDAE